MNWAEVEKAIATPEGLEAAAKMLAASGQQPPQGLPPGVFGGILATETDKTSPLGDALGGLK